MAVRIVAGRAGSGKSMRCFRHIVEALRADPLGKPIFWVVPRQATFSTERWLTCGSGLAGFTRCRVVSFEGLAKEVLTATGHGSRATLSKVGRRAVIAHLLREHAQELKYFRPSARRPGMAEEILTFLDELSRNGATDTLRASLPELEMQPALHGKLADVLLIHEAYLRFVGPEAFDKDARMAQVLRNVSACPSFQGATVFVDGFTDLLDFERRMLVSLCDTAADVDISLCMDPGSPLLDAFDALPEEDSVFHKIESAQRSLRMALRERQLPVEIVRLRGASRFTARELLAVERELAGQPTVGTQTLQSAVVVPKKLESLRLFEATDARAEVERVALEIRALVRGGMRYRDIVVLVRQLETYRAHLSSVFGEHGIAFFMDYRRDASYHPLIRLIRSVLSISTGGFSTAEMLTILKSGIIDECPAELVSQAENWAVSRGIRGDAWRVAHRSEPPTIEGMRLRVVGTVAEFADAMNAEGGLSLRDACTRLLTLVEALGVRASLAAWVKLARNDGDGEGVAEHTQVWAEVSALLDELAELLGDATTNAADFQQTLLAGLDGLSLGLTPLTTDSVLVGSADRTRPGDARAAFVLGLSEGVFPPALNETGLLSDRERRALRTALPIDADTDRRQIDELLTGYLALTRARDVLFVSRPQVGANGAPLGPSLFWEAVSRAVPEALVEKPQPGELLDRVATPKALGSALLQWARDSKAFPHPAFSQLYEHFVTVPEAGSPLAETRLAVWGALRPSRVVPPLTPMVARALYGESLDLTDRQLEHFAACPFQHFLTHGLKLAESKEPVFGADRLSLVLHGALARLTQTLLGLQKNWHEILPADRDAQIEKVADEAIAEALTRITYDGSSDRTKLIPRDRYALARIVARVTEVVEAHRAGATRTRFNPYAAGHRFGSSGRRSGGGAGSAALKVILQDETEAHISGSIDRIEENSSGRLAAWDYGLRDGARGISLPEMFYGLSLRPLVHLLVLRETSGELPAGVLSNALLGPVRVFHKLTDWQKADKADSPAYFLGRRKSPGLLDIDILSDFDIEAGSASPGTLVSVRLTKEGKPYKGDRGALTGEEISALLDHGEYLLSRLASLLREGHIEVKPFQFKNTSACATCDYGAACRFSPRDGDQYENLGDLTADQVRERLIHGAGGEGDGSEGGDA